MNGFLNLLKPPGMTSSDAVVCIRRTLKDCKVGHAGTLDPEAAGVLPIMVGKAVRLFDVLADKQKAYVAEIAFGASTDTQDAQGAVTERSSRVPDEADVRAVLPRFIGEIEQIPPAYSALKIDGKPSYVLARKGQAEAIAARKARIDAILLLETTCDGGMLLEVKCGKGVYIRTLCHDIGASLGCPAHMRFLLRTHSGTFSIDKSVTLEEWLASENRAERIEKMDAHLAHLPMARVQVKWADAIRNGQALTCFERIDEAAKQGTSVRVYCGDSFAGLARWEDDSLRIRAMLMD